MEEAGVSRGLSSGGRPTARRARLLALPHRQVALAAAGSIGALLVVSVLAVSQATLASRDLQSAQSRLAPVDARVTIAQSTYAAMMQDARALTIKTPVTPNVQDFTNAQDAWTAYKRVAVRLPGESKLQAAFDKKQTVLTATLATFVAGTATETDLANVTSDFAKGSATLTEIARLYDVAAQQAYRAVQLHTDAVRHDVLVASGASLALLCVGFVLVFRSTRSRERANVTNAAERARELRRGELETELQRGLELVSTEEACYRIVQKALRRNIPTVAAELLVADSSRAHFQQVCRDEAGGPGCPVISPNECPAARRGQTETFASSTAISACPYLQERPSGDCSAVCVPVSIAGKTIGVLHATAPDREPPDRETAADIELIARKVGERLGLLRAFSRSESQAHTDPLTGLCNRRSLESQVRDVVHEDLPYVVAYGDLDHFKDRNDVYGHDAGDRALRLFARVLRDNLRPNDIPARYGGEEFVIVFPNCPVGEAEKVVERIQERLGVALYGGTVPPFTASFGLAASDPVLTFSETLEAADASLLQAKIRGRDRIVVAGADTNAVQPAPAMTETLSPATP